MPMEVLYSQPYLITQTDAPTGFPQTIDVLIGGRSYVANTSFEPYRRDAFRHRSIQAQRESISLDNLPGEGTVNTEGLWRREAWDWHFGAGQPYQDRKDSVDGRFSTSKGVNPWMQWQLELLEDTGGVLPLVGNGQVLQVGKYIYVLDLQTHELAFTDDFLTWTEVATGGVHLTMLATDGYDLYVSNVATGEEASIYKGTPGGPSLAPLVTTGQFGGVWWVGERLMAVGINSVYNIIAPGPAPSPLWTHPNPNFEWTAMCAGSSQIYMAGYDPGEGRPLASVVYRTTIEATGTALTIPVQALPMEGGEYCTALYGYLNYIFVGSNLGTRMCRTIAAYDPTGNEGDLEAGPLTPGLFPPGPVNSPVQCFTANNRFVYFGWSNYDEFNTGIGRLDLSTFIDTQAPAFASDLMAPGQGGIAQGAITSMDWCTISNAPIFVVEGLGVYTANGATVQTGYVTSGAVGYGISDNKILWAGDIGTVQPQHGTVTMSVAVDGAAQTLVGTQNSTAGGGSTIQSPFPIGQIRGDQTTVLMTLTATGGISPILHRWTLKALPAITAGTTISAVILLYETVNSRGGDIYYDSYAEYQYLYNLRTTQTLVEYKEGPFSAMCVIDELDWLPFKEHDSAIEGGFIGDLICYLKTVDIGAWMAGPAYVLRDYSGGVPEGVQLTAQIGSTDTSFTIANTTGWVNAANQPLGTVGPFTCIIDLGTATAEKILCSAVNLTSGLVTVYTSAGFSGRGYDQTTPQGHVPGGSVTGVQPCWSAVEATEANRAVFDLLGGGNLPGSVGGRCYAASGTGITGTNLVALTNAQRLTGGVTFQTTSGNSGLVVPTTGSYAISGQVRLAGTAANLLTAYIAKNANATFLAIGSLGTANSPGQNPSSVVSDAFTELTAGDVINLGYTDITTNAAFQIDSNHSSVYLSIALMAAG